MAAKIQVSSAVVLMALTLCHVVCGQTMPAGCSYNGGLYTCDYTSLNGASLIPLDQSQFSPNPPQRIRITGPPASMSSAIFNFNFSTISASSYDTNYPATLEIECQGTGTTLTAGCFATMSHVQHFRILNCALSAIPANAFTELGSLDLFAIENGSISSFDQLALSGVTIEPQLSASPSFLQKFGEFSLKNTKVSTALPDTLLASQTGLNSLVLEGIGMTSLNPTFLSTLTNLHLLSLSNNNLTELQSGLFSGLNQLGEVQLSGMELGCSCTSLWFLDKDTTNYLDVIGDIICTSPATYANKKARQYYSENCITIPATCADGVELSGSCLSAIDLTAYSIGGVAFILGWVVLGMTIHTRKNAGASGGPRRKSPRKPGQTKTRPMPKASKA